MKHNTNANTMVVVDPSLENYQQLIDGLQPGAKPFLLDPQSDGIEQIGEQLLQHRETEVLHLLSHGSPGCLYLGNSQLSLDTLGDYASTLRGWKIKKLLLYGCNVAAGDAGEELMAKLQALTAADIAASTTRTGAAARGGNWELEWRTPGMETPLALSAEALLAYGGILAPLNQQDYEALRRLYQGTGGATSWDDTNGWEDWDFNSNTLPDESVVANWSGVTVDDARVTGLYLDGNGLTGSIPNELGNLSNLRDLDLGENGLTGSIPPQLENLSNLEKLDLSNNDLTGTIPSELGNLSNLEEDLNLSNNDLTGTIPTELGNLSNLEKLDLSNNDLTGTIPSELGNLSNLQELWLQSNELTGTIPPQLGNLSNLVELYLDNNELTGTIPPQLRNLSNLVELWLDNNRLTGTIPSQLGNLSNLKDLYLDNNELTGTIPPQLGNLSNLVEFNLQSNDLTGTIPSQLGNLSNLVELNLQSNDLTGTIPSQLGNLFNLEVLDLSNNQLSGTIPTELGDLSNLEALDLSNNNLSVSSSIFQKLNNLNLEQLDLSGNNPLVNPLLSDYQALRALYDATNGDSWQNNEGWNFSSPTPPNDLNDWFGVTVENGRVTVIELEENGLTGSIPSELGNLSNLDDLLLSSNNLTGTIPPQLGNLSNLEDLYLDNNDLTGTIPPQLGNLSNLDVLDLDNNDLTGTIPSELGNLSNLEDLYLFNNDLTGTIPPQLGNLSNLKELWLFNNRLTGSIPPQLGNFFNLEELWLFDNRLTGTIPQEVLNLRANKLLENPPYVRTEIPDFDFDLLSGNNFNEDISDNFGDINGNINNYTAIGLPEGLTINSRGVISGIPTTAGNFTVTVTAIDENLGEGTDTFSINVVGNSTPTDLVLSKSSINENSPLGAVVGTFSTSDADIGDSFTYQLLFGSNAFTIVGNELQTNSSLDFETQSSYEIFVRTTDAAGASYSEALTINVTDVAENSSPTDIVLSNSSINENSPLGAVVGTFSTSDADIGDSFTYQLLSGSNAFTIVGDELRTNSSLDFETQSSYEIFVRTTDAAGASYSEVLTINVTDVAENSSPTDIVLSNSSIDENSPSDTVVGTFSTTDPDEGDTFSYQLISDVGPDDNDAFTIEGDRLRINSSPDFETQSSYSILVQTTDAAGDSFSRVLIIEVNDVAESPTDIELSSSSIDENSPLGAVVGTFSTTDPNSGDTFTYQLVSGVGDDDNAAFTIVGDQLRINSSLDFETQSSYSIRVQTTDATGASYEEVLTINVNDVAENSSPTDIVLSNSSIDENSPLGVVVGTFGTTDADIGDSFTYQLLFGSNAFTIVGDELLTNSSLDFETQSSYNIGVRTTDQTGASYEEVLTINVNDVAESPTDIELSGSINVNENSPANTVVGILSTTDPNSGDTFTYELVSGVGDDDNAAFTIVGNQLRINSSPDFETQSSYSIRVQTTDQTGASYSEALTINVTDVAENSSPTDIVLSSSIINENSPSGAVVGTFGTSDPDEGDTFTYRLVSGFGGDDNAAFTIVGDQLRINSSLDFETQSIYRILVQTTDQTGASYSEVLTINVTDVAENSPPTDITLSNNSITENAPLGSIVGTFSTTDPDEGDSFTYQLLGVDNTFTIVGNQLLTNSSLDFETRSSYSIGVRTTDETGAGYSEVLTINVTDVVENSPPTDITLSNSSITENAPLDSIVGTLSTIDPDISDTFTYRLVPGVGDFDNAAFTIVGNQLRVNSFLGIETQPSYSIRVQTTDATGASYEEVFTIDIAENSPPTNIVLSGNSIDENPDPVNSVVGTLFTIDPDISDTFTYRLVPGVGDFDNGAFMIVSNLLIKSSPDVETRSSYNIRVQTTDGAGASYSEVFTINVNDVLEVASLIVGQDDRLQEDDPLTGGNGSDRVYGNDGLIGGDGNDSLYGRSQQADLFVLESGGMGYTIIDFEDGTDSIGLTEGLSFNDLAIVRMGLDTRINFEGKTLATLQGIDSTLINVDDFTVVN